MVKDDDQYFGYLEKKYQKFQKIYKDDYSLFSELMNEEEFSEFKKNTKKDLLSLFSPRLLENLY